jgi:membrane-bound serine protease (ClpP class)
MKSMFKYTPKWLLLVGGLFLSLQLMANPADSVPVAETATTAASPGKKQKIYYINLSKEIMPAAGRLISKAITAAETEEVDILILNLNTYGGRLDVADSIRSRLLYSKAKTIAFINNNAASAGALISLACDSIYMVPGASIGAATVVDQAGEEVPDKYQSYMRGMMRSTAETKGRDPRIAEAMVDASIFIEGIIDSGKVLTLTAKEAVELGIADGLANNMQEVIEKLGITEYTLTEHQESSLDKFINFLLNPIVNSILLLLIVGGIYFELKTPGVGFPLIAALIGAILYFAPLLIDGSAAVWEVLLFIIGVILLLVEIFIIPGFGVAGISGIILIIAGLTFSLVGVNWSDMNFIAMDLLARAFFRVMLTFIGGMALLFTFGGSALSLPGFRRMVLAVDQKSEDGYSTRRNELYDLIGMEAETISTLRPSGKVLLNGEIYDAVSESSFIDPKTAVIIRAVEGYSLLVRRKEV